jgi:hypothetical protein
MRTPLSIAALLLALGALAPSPAEAQQGQRPDAAQAQGEQSPEMREQMQQIRAMMPMMATMLQSVTQGTMSALAEPEVARNLARFTRNYYEALMAAGFTREEALRIVSSVGFPSLPSM